MYFHEKSVIISLFLVRFQIRLNHMKDLLILHVTKEKKISTVQKLQNSQKMYFFGIWQPSLIFKRE